MTVYDLHFLISEQTNTILTVFETWVGVTAAVLLAAHYGGKSIGPWLRKIIIGAYIFSSFSSIIGLLQGSYAILKYQEQIAAQAGMNYPFIPFLGETNGLINLIVLVVITASTAAYFIHATSHKSASSS